MLSTLTTAAATRERVWVGYVDSAGVARSRILEAERVEGGYLTAYDAARATLHRLALHRITGVALLEAARPEPDPAPPGPDPGPPGPDPGRTPSPLEAPGGAG
jgi:hypothetical protein